MAIFIGSESSIPHSLRTHARASGKEDIAPDATQWFSAPCGQSGGDTLSWPGFFFRNSVSQRT